MTDGQPQIQGHVLLSGGSFRTPNGAWLVAENGTVTVTSEISIEEAQFINQGLFEVTSPQSVYFNSDSLFINRAPGTLNFKSAGGFNVSALRRLFIPYYNNDLSRITSDKAFSVTNLAQQSLVTHRLGVFQLSPWRCTTMAQ